ncbi:MAG: hypothetical protein ACQESJ_07205 [Bacteroidota bacterium]
MKKFNNPNSLIVIVVVTVAVVMVNFSHHKWQKENIIEWDIKAYYSYLPAVFIYNDLTLEFTDTNSRLYDKTWPVNLPNGNKLIVASYGLSVMYAPFFLIAHAYASLSGTYEADGYTMPYELALNFSSVFFFIIGLFFLRKLLHRYFNDWITALVILLLGVGTNLSFYVTYEAAMSHSYSFALITIFVYYVIKWYESPTRKMAVLLGFLFGLVVLIRPTNILVLLFLILWDVQSWQGLKERILFFLKRFDYVLIMLAMFLLVWSPQFAYWKMITDKWIFYSYGAKEASFYWHNPQIWNILFSYKKGWFVYTPIMFIAFIGIFFLPYRLKSAFWAVLVFILANIYVQSTWWSWWFGGGFGIRTFVDSYGIMAIPLATLIKTSSEKTVSKFAVPIVLIVLAWYNTFQIRQYRNNAIHWWWNTKEAYWENFLKAKPQGRYYDYVRLPDYYLARHKGEYVAITPVEKRRRDLWRSYRDTYITKINKDQKVLDSLKIYTAAVEKTLDEAIFELATKNVNTLLEENKTKIKEKIDNDKTWKRFVEKQAKQLDVSYDSSMNIETKRIIESRYD